MLKVPGASGGSWSRWRSLRLPSLRRRPGAYGVPDARSHHDPSLGASGASLAGRGSRRGTSSGFATRSQRTASARSPSRRRSPKSCGSTVAARTSRATRARVLSLEEGNLLRRRRVPVRVQRGAEARRDQRLRSPVPRPPAHEHHARRGCWSEPGRADDEGWSLQHEDDADLPSRRGRRLSQTRPTAWRRGSSETRSPSRNFVSAETTRGPSGALSFGQNLLPEFLPTPSSSGATIDDLRAPQTSLGKASDVPSAKEVFSAEGDTAPPQVSLTPAT